jgi:hypothetical protein
MGVTLLFQSALVSGRMYSDVSRFQRVVFPWGSPAALAGTPRIIHYDQAKSYYPWQVFMSASLRGGDVPLWNPYAFAGTPFLAANANNVLYPPRVALSLVVSPARVHDVFVAGHMFLAGLTMYFLLAYLRTSFSAALLGAVAWMTSSFMLAWLALEHFVVVAALLPLAVHLTDVSLRRRSWPAALALGVVLALLFLGANILFVQLCFAAVGGYGIELVVGRVLGAMRRHDLRCRSGELGRDVALLAVPWVLCAGMSAVTLLPTIELIGSIARTPLSYGELRSLRLPFSELANLVVAPSLDDASFLRDPYHAAIFAGTAVALLALIGLSARRRGAWFARVLAAVTLLVALGTPALALPYWTLPGFDNLKPLGRVLFLFAFALAILAAFGLDAVLGWIRGHTRGRSTVVLSYLVPLVLITATVVQLRAYAGDVLHSQEPIAEERYPPTPLVERLVADPDARIFPVGGTLPGSTSLVYPLRNALGYESLVPGRVQDFWRVMSGLPPSDLSTTPVRSAFEPVPSAEEVRLDLLPRAGVDYVVLPPLDAATARTLAARGLDSVYEGPDGSVLSVDGALPRAYLVAGCEEAADARSALGRFQAPAFDPRQAVILERTALRAAGVRCERRRRPMEGSARIVRDEVDNLALEVDAKAAGFLVVNETWDAGWRATVDGRKAPVLAANASFRALPIEAGRHRVELRYAPRAYEAGRVISSGTVLVTLLLFGVLAARSWSGRRRTSARARASATPHSSV